MHANVSHLCITYSTVYLYIVMVCHTIATNHVWETCRVNYTDVSSLLVSMAAQLLKSRTSMHERVLVLYWY